LSIDRSFCGNRLRRHVQDGRLAGSGPGHELGVGQHGLAGRLDRRGRGRSARAVAPGRRGRRRGRRRRGAALAEEHLPLDQAAGGHDQGAERRHLKVVHAKKYTLQFQ